jgi:hypothetical protein
LLLNIQSACKYHNVAENDKKTDIFSINIPGGNENFSALQKDK